MVDRKCMRSMPGVETSKHDDGRLACVHLGDKAGVTDDPQSDQEGHRGDMSDSGSNTKASSES